MGTWGPGNFDSDDAVDYLSEVVRGFVGTVEQWFAQGRANLDDQGEGRLMPTVEMISVLCDWCRGGPPAIRMVAPPRPGVIRQWKQQVRSVVAAPAGDHAGALHRDQGPPAAAMCAINRDLLASAQRRRQLLLSIPAAPGGTTASLGGTAVDWSAASCCL